MPSLEAPSKQKNRWLGTDCTFLPEKQRKRKEKIILAFWERRVVS